MRRGVVASSLLMLVTAGCSSVGLPVGASHCTSSAECTRDDAATGQCVEGLCAFPDPNCTSGLKWDETAAGMMSNQCVPAATADLMIGSDLAPGDMAAPDAPLGDMAPDGTAPGDLALDGASDGCCCCVDLCGVDMAVFHMPDLLMPDLAMPYAAPAATPGFRLPAPVVLPWTLYGYFGIATGDFDGDGKDDIAAARSSESNAIAILLGHGDGTFSSPTLIDGGPYPSNVFAGDVDGDGKLDLVVAADIAPNNLRVLLGDGKGGFAAPVSYLAAGDQQGSSDVLADFNGDGKPDYAGVSWSSQGGIDVSLNDGAGAFPSGTLYPGGNFASSLAAADFNGDRVPDLVAPLLVGLTVLLNDGSGSFSTGPALSAPLPYLTAIAALDADGDRHTDVAVSNPRNGAITIFHGDGTGSLTAKWTGPDGARGMATWTVVADDFSGDGKPDLAIVDGAGDSVRVLVNRGDGTFSRARDFPVAASIPNMMVSADFDGDGRKDLAGTTFTGAVWVLLNAGEEAPATTIAAAAPVDYSTGGAPDGLALADFNRDGKLDVATANDASGDVSVLLGNGDGTLAAQTKYGCGGACIDLVAGDFDLDGDSDLLVANDATSNDAHLLLNAGDGTFGTPTAYSLGGAGPAGRCAVGDIDGDSWPDVACATGNVSVLFNDFEYSGSFATALHIGPSAGIGTIALADFNNDGLLDIAGGAGNQIVVLLDDGNPVRTFRAAKSYATPNGAGWIVPADFDGDGNLDIATAGSPGSFLHGNGDGTFAAATSFATPGGIQVTADLNRDGWPDLVGVDIASSNLILIAGGPSASFGTPVLPPSGTNPWAVKAGDLNGDDLPDLIVTHRYGTTVSVLLNTSK